MLFGGLRLATVTLIPFGRPDWTVQALRTGLARIPEDPILQTAFAEAVTPVEGRDPGGCGR
jgi:hypothetical protein